MLGMLSQYLFNILILCCLLLGKGEWLEFYAMRALFLNHKEVD